MSSSKTVVGGAPRSTSTWLTSATDCCPRPDISTATLDDGISAVGGTQKPRTEAWIPLASRKRDSGASYLALRWASSNGSGMRAQKLTAGSPS